MYGELRFVDFLHALKTVWRKRVLILVISVLCFLIGVFLTLNHPVNNVYSARTTVYSATYGSYQQSLTGTNAMIDYADIVSSKKVCQRAASILDVVELTSDEIQTMISADFNSNSYVMNIYANSTDPILAQKVANAVAQAFVIEMNGITGGESIQLLDEAEHYFLSYNSSKKLMLKRLLFGLSGLILSATFLVINELLSSRIKTMEQCISLSEGKLLGMIPYIEKGTRKK